MREIIFRGKRRDNGEWVYGNLVHKTSSVGDRHLTVIVCSAEWDNSNGWYHFCNEHLVDYDTLGQFTGLLDKNGVKVFEGDIVKYIPRPGCEIIYKIIWQQDYSRFCLVQWSTHKYKLYEWAEPDKVKYMCEIIGNIYDNPELLV